MIVRTAPLWAMAVPRTEKLLLPAAREGLAESAAALVRIRLRVPVMSTVRVTPGWVERSRSARLVVVRALRATALLYTLACQCDCGNVSVLT